MSSLDSSDQKQSIAPAELKTDSAKAGGPWLRYVALLTGVLAGLGGFLTVRGASMSNDAIYRNTKAVLFQAHASDTWTEYQANSIKAHVLETQLDIDNGTMAPAVRKKLEDEESKYRARQPALKQTAQADEATRDQFRDGADKVLNEKGQLDIAGVAVQLGIALASVAGLTRRKEAFVAGILAGAFGAGLTAYVLVHHFLAK